MMLAEINLMGWSTPPPPERHGYFTPEVDENNGPSTKWGVRIVLILMALLAMLALAFVVAIPVLFS